MQSFMIGIHVFAKVGKQFCIDSTFFETIMHEVVNLTTGGFKFRIFVLLLFQGVCLAVILIIL